MLTFHSVQIGRDLHREDPLFVGNFFQLGGMWWKKRKQRQGLIISIALGWYRLMKKQSAAPGFIQDEVLLTSLTRQVKDAKVILEHFFEIDRLGFNFNDGNKSPTIVSPKKLAQSMIDAVEEIINEVHFYPGAAPSANGLIASQVPIMKNRGSFIRTELIAAQREDLWPAVSWLLKQESVTFYYKPSGKLQARDTSVWPVRAIELWPGWLRRELFGTVIDIENAYCQFLVSSLCDKYRSNPNRMELKYPDLLRIHRDKQNFREELCRDILKLPVTDENISAVKRLIMSLANGSNASPALMTSGSSRSDAVRIVLTANKELKPSELVEAGRKLSFLAKQFRAAKKDLCSHLLNEKSSAANVKKIFKLYFEWEREQRYKIWNAIGQTGLMLHDGLDGIVTDMDDAALEKYIVNTTSIKVSVSSPELEAA